MSVSPGDMDRMWGKLGFDVDHSGHHVKATLVVNDRVVLRTRRSHGAKGTAGRIPHYIRQKMRLNDSQFRDALACPLDAKTFIEILTSKGLIEETPKTLGGTDFSVTAGDNT